MSNDPANPTQLVDDVALEARRAALVARYGRASAALLPCPREIALRDGTWAYVVPGDPDTGPSLMGWRIGPASTLPAELLRDVTTMIRTPMNAAEMWDEHRHWLHRAEVHRILDGPGLPLWVRARQAVVTARLDALFLALPNAAAREEWRGLAGDDAGPGQARSDEPSPPEVTSPDASKSRPDSVQSGQPLRKREEARKAVRLLLVEGLTDREIARRVGVSPSTVGVVRKAQP